MGLETKNICVGEGQQLFTAMPCYAISFSYEVLRNLL
jgi:hypothetical protein